MRYQCVEIHMTLSHLNSNNNSECHLGPSFEMKILSSLKRFPKADINPEWNGVLKIHEVWEGGGGFLL